MHEMWTIAIADLGVCQSVCHAALSWIAILTGLETPGDIVFVLDRGHDPHCEGRESSMRPSSNYFLQWFIADTKMLCVKYEHELFAWLRRHSVEVGEPAKTQTSVTRQCDGYIHYWLGYPTASRSRRRSVVFGPVHSRRQH